MVFGVFGSVVCTNQNNAQIDKNKIVQNDTVNTQENAMYPTETDKVIRMYNEFLEGKISVEGIDMNFLTTPKGEPDRHYTTKYALFDSNGDKIPELHINSARYYYILSYINNKLIIWKNMTTDPQTYTLKNGAFISKYFGAAPLSDDYTYFILNFLGN
jgi:hypothetical protein